MITMAMNRKDADDMEKEYDFSKAKPSPYVKRPAKKAITINLDVTTIDYFKKLSEESNIPYQTIINFYLRDCARNHRVLGFVSQNNSSDEQA